jgi:aspartyl-tRNA(Asn)/glutamyl-tRNA(Gln) amidotransferase subunit C
MNLTEKDIDKLASLARLKLSADEKTRLHKELNKILEYMEIIDELSTDMINDISLFRPGSISRETSMPLRDDIPQQGLTGDDALRNAPEIDNGFFIVPKVIDK